MRFAAAAILLHAATAAAETPAELAKRLVDFAHDGCRYMASHSPPADYHSSQPRLASHFGRIVKRLDDGSGLRGVVVTVPQFRGWHAEIHARVFTFTIPADVQLRLKDLAQLLGTPHSPPDDMQLKTAADSDSAGDPGPRPRDWEFAFLPDWPTCAIDAEVDGIGDDRMQQRVLQLGFVDYHVAPGR